MALGIRPVNDFAFKKVFGSDDNAIALIHLLNAILKPVHRIVAVTVQNPFNLQDFQDDKLSILDIKAIDNAGAIYHIEMQLTVPQGCAQRMLFYGCELVVDQLQSGDDYSELRPVYSICLLNENLWSDADQVHHTFRLTDRQSGRVLSDVLEIHTLELGRYNLQERDLATADELDRWLYWLKHAHEYEADQLRLLFAQPGFHEATDTLIRIAEITEDKTMYDAREKAARDYRWQINSAFREGEAKGKLEGEIKLIRTLQGLLHLPVGDALATMTLEQLIALTDELQQKLRGREPE